MIQFLAKVCHPATLLMSKFSYFIKFGLVSVVIITPLIVSLLFLQGEYGNEIRFIKKEQKGLALLSITQQDLSKLVIAKTLNNPTFESSIAKVDSASFKLLAPEVSAKLDNYRLAKTEQFQHLSSLMQSIADYSNLELDLSLDTSYLVTTIVKRIPALQFQLAETLRLASEVTQSGSFTPDTYIALSNANQTLPFLITQAHDSLLVSVNKNQIIRAELGGAWASLEKEIWQLQKTIKTSILDPDEIELSASELASQGASINEAIVTFSGLVIPVAANLLQQRIEAVELKKNIVMTISLLSVMVMLYLFTGMYLSIIDNINRVTSAVHSIAKGNLNTKVEVIGKDEMRLIANDMNLMTANLRQLVERISQAIDTLSESAKSLKSVTQQTIAGVDEQQQGTKTIVTSMLELTSSAKVIDENSDQALNAASDADKEAKEGIALVSALKAVMHDMQQESSRSQDALERLVKDSNDIGQVSSGINEIAEQTNLLALNAAIEAARAGEQGRGFAVVADEVRTLAKRTQDQTSQIHEIISNIQQATHDTKLSMEQNREQMDKSVQEAESVSHALGRISQVVTTINQMNSEISKSSSSQSFVTNQVASKVENIASISEATLTGAKETGQSADRLLAVVDTLSVELSQLQKGHE